MKDFGFKKASWTQNPMVSRICRFKKNSLSRPLTSTRRAEVSHATQSLNDLLLPASDSVIAKTSLCKQASEIQNTQDGVKHSTSLADNAEKKALKKALRKQIGSIITNAAPRLLTELIFSPAILLSKQYQRQVSKSNQQLPTENNSNKKDSKSYYSQIGKIKASIPLSALNDLLEEVGDIETEHATLKNTKFYSKENLFYIETILTPKNSAEIKFYDKGFMDGHFYNGFANIGVKAFNHLVICKNNERKVNAQLAFSFVNKDSKYYLKLQVNELHITYDGQSSESRFMQYIANNPVAKSYMSIDLPVEDYMNLEYQGEDMGLSSLGTVSSIPQSILTVGSDLKLIFSLQTETKAPVNLSKEKTDRIELLKHNIQNSIFNTLRRTTHSVIDQARKSFSYTAVHLSEKKSSQREPIDAADFSDSDESGQSTASNQHILGKIILDLDISTLNNAIDQVKICDGYTIKDVSISKQGRQLILSGTHVEANKLLKGFVQLKASNNHHLGIRLSGLRYGGLDIRDSALSYIKHMGYPSDSRFEVEVPLADLVGTPVVNLSPAEQADPTLASIRLEVKKVKAAGSGSAQEQGHIRLIVNPIIEL